MVREMFAIFMPGPDHLNYIRIAGPEHNNELFELAPTRYPGTPEMPEEKR